MANWFLYRLTALTALCGFLFGYDTGIISGALIYVKEEMRLNTIWQELMVSSTIAFAWIFSMFVASLSDRLGRKPVILIASFIFTVGSLIMGLAFNKWMLLIGRSVAGIAIGFASSVAPIYIAELAPKERRGSLVTLNHCFITFGQFSASLLAGGFAYLPNTIGWRFMLAFAGVPSLIQFVWFFFLPESPRWLVMKHKDERAYTILSKIYQDSQLAQDELASIKRSQQFEIERQLRIDAEYSSGQTLKSPDGHLQTSPPPTRPSTPSYRQKLQRIMCTPNVRKALIIGCCLQMFQQMVGVNTLMYYSTTIIQMTGIHDKRYAIWLSAIVAGTNFSVSSASLPLVDRVRRRTLTLVSLFGALVSLVILAGSFKFSLMKEQVRTNLVGYANDSCLLIDRCSTCVTNLHCGYCYNAEDQYNTAQCLSTSPDNLFKSVPGTSCSNGTTTDWVWNSSFCPSLYPMVTLFGLCLYLFSFAPGMGPMPWTINAELYPLWSRSTCTSITTAVNWFFNLVTSLTFLTLTEILTIHGTFAFFFAWGFTGLIVFYFFLPETKNKSMEDEVFASNDIPVTFGH